ncbi:MAG: ANTAR domain-containing protein [Firmicutes bacterium]|nr:ANTAR domain-containing protein [Bacillota bacterium]
MSRLRVLLGEPDGRSRNRIKKMLEAEGYLVVAETDDGMGTLRQARMVRPDIAVVSEDLMGMKISQVITVLLEDRICPTVMITGSSSSEVIEAAKQVGVLGLVSRPVQKHMLVASLELAYEHYRRMSEMEHEIEELKDKLENRKLIEKAKGIVMSNLRLSESEAYRYIQTRSMNQKTPMKQIAQAIILAFENSEK